MVHCMNRELRERVPSKLLNFEIPAELYGYFESDIKDKNRQLIEERLLRADMRIYFRKKIFEIVAKDPRIFPFEE